MDCDGRETRLLQYDEPRWEPLEAAVGMTLAGGFMWMHEEVRADGSTIQAYKHIHTRRYLYLDGEGHAYEVTGCGAKARLRLDFAIQAALCTWWLLAGSTDEDRDEIREAVARAQASADMTRW